MPKIATNTIHSMTDGGMRVESRIV